MLDELNAALRPHGLRFAPDISTASRATVGGMMANNSSGARSVLYGKTIDHVLEQHVVLSDGSVAHFRVARRRELDAICARRHARGRVLPRRCGACRRSCADEIERRYPKVLRRVGGYNLDAFVDRDAPFNLTKLMVGSEGTLGVVARSEGQPRAAAEGEGGAGDPVRGSARSARGDAGDPRAQPSAVEVMDRFILDNTKQSPALERLRRTFIEGDPGALLCVEFYADRADDLPPRLDALERDLAARGFGYRYHRAIDLPAQARDLEPARSGARPVDGDEGRREVAVVRRRHGGRAGAAARLHRALPRDRSATHGTNAGVYAHASVGCLHVRPVVNLKTEAGVAQFEAIAPATSPTWCSSSAARSRASTATGWSAARSWRRCSGRCSTRRSATSSARSTRDGIFNPGQDRRRAAADRRTCATAPAIARRSPSTFFDYSEYGGMAGAVEMCSGLGACRKTLDGTMCPSYMATREEAHSTRGRANVLRLAMAGRLGESGLATRASREVLDLCLECRACKAECPVGVDVARFKSEFLADYWRAPRHAARARACSDTSTSCRAGAAGSRRFERAWRAARRRAGSTSACSASIAAACRRRGRSRHVRDAVSRDARRRRADAPSVLLFNDTFTNYYNPGDRRWPALDVLESARLRRGAGAECLLRPAADLAGAARRRATARAAVNTDALVSAGRAGRPLVFFEPSCLSAMSRDAPALLRGDAQARARAGRATRAMLFEEFVEQHVRPGAHRCRFEAGPVANPAARPLPSEVDGPAGAGEWRCCRAFPARSRRSRRRLLRHGRVLRIHARALRRVTGDRRAAAAAGGARASTPTACSSRAASRAVTRSRTLPASRALHPAELLQSLTHGVRMNLAVISVAALVACDHRQLCQHAECRRAGGRARLDRRRLHRRHARQHRDGRVSRRSCS